MGGDPAVELHMCRCAWLQRIHGAQGRRLGWRARGDISVLVAKKKLKIDKSTAFWGVQNETPPPPLDVDTSPQDPAQEFFSTVLERSREWRFETPSPAKIHGANHPQTPP